MFYAKATYPAEASESYAEDSFKMEHVSSKRKIIYEQPLNERIRAWLRLEHLFSCIAYHMKGLSAWDSRSAIECLIEILEFIARIDTKNDLLKDLDRHAQELEHWQQTPGVDQHRLGQILEKLNTIITNLTEMETQISHRLLQNQLINSVRQRLSIPGGTCRFDVPAYHYWLQQPPKQRQNDVAEWLKPLDCVREGIELHLYLTRNHATTSYETAAGGFFQAKLDAQTSFQLVRITLPSDHSYYAEISGGKHRFTVRFFEYGDVSHPPVPTQQDISFELCCCTA